MYPHEINANLSNPKKKWTVKVNSRICIKDVDSGEVFTFFLVPPEELDAKNGKISILTTLGAALIGKGVGNVVTWQAPSGPRRFEVQSVFC
ncbi:hypothetical protein JCM12296A_53820 [Desulfosarcina cetonica]|uniref:GreA/GreB family elongation factor n=1 Tax=Desulfosarcina cetonica TaxID=90730 RepID=UPI0009F9DC05|nr:GreA/GreB family elongation factor [Desulfosarcina cetonica]